MKLKKLLATILATCLVLTFFIACNANNSNSQDDESRYISYIKNCTVLNVSKLYRDNTTYGDLLSNKYFNFSIVPFPQAHHACSLMFIIHLCHHFCFFTACCFHADRLLSQLICNLFTLHK